MIHEGNEQIVLLTVIAGRKQKDALLTALLKLGICLTNTVYGKGAVRVSGVKYVLGLIPEENKVLITCVSTSDKAGAALRMLAEEFHFDKPNTGIAFIVNIDHIEY